MPRTLVLFVSPVLVAISLFLGSRIALHTASGAHPDEWGHLDAFCYFGTHWWPPPLNVEGLLYSPDGWSRVYNGEVVYLVYGKLGAWLPLAGLLPSNVNERPPAPASLVPLTPRIYLPLVDRVIILRVTPACLERLTTYRVFNLALYGVTLLAILRRPRPAWVYALGALLLAIPQVLYVYAYANSDAWGLSFGIFLVLFAVSTWEGSRPGWWQAAGLGALTGLVLLSKSPFWVLIPLAYLIAGAGILRRAPRPGHMAWRDAAVLLLIWVGVTAAVALPLKVVYPLTQGDYAGKALQMREERARWDFAPSNPIWTGYLLAKKGASFTEVAGRRAWWLDSLYSFYGKFGYMTIVSPAWAYRTAGALVTLGVLTTLGFLLLAWKRVPAFTRLLVAASPLFICLNLLASLYNSWTYDFQPQGRYLFPSLIPLAILLAGTMEQEPRWLRRLRLLSWACLYGLGVYVIWSVVLPAPLLLYG
jgi:hypothetical protein